MRVFLLKYKATDLYGNPTDDIGNPLPQDYSSPIPVSQQTNTVNPLTQAPAVAPPTVAQAPTQVPTQQSAGQNYSQDLFSQYDTSPQGNMKDDVYNYAMIKAFNPDKKKEPYTFASKTRLTNEDFYQPTGIPLVAGSISGKVIGTQLITGGGEGFSQFPWAAMFSERDRLQNILVNALKPVAQEELKFTNPQAPKVDGRYANQFSEAWGKMVNEEVSEAQKYGVKGLNYLATPGTPANLRFVQKQQNLAYVADNINDILKTTDEWSKTIDSKGLQLDSKASSSLKKVNRGLVKLFTDGEAPTFNLQEEIKNVEYGIGVADVVKNVKENYFKTIQQSIQSAKGKYDLNGDAESYLTVMENLKTTYGIDGEEFYPDGVTYETATKEQRKEAMMKKAEQIVSPYLESHWGENVPKDVMDRTVRGVYENLSQVQKEMTMQTVGSRKPVPNITNTYVKTVNDPVPANINSHLQMIKARGSTTVGSAGKQNVKIMRAPSGDLMVMQVDKNGLVSEQTIKPYSTESTNEFLIAMGTEMSKIEMSQEDAMRWKQMQLTKGEDYEAWNSTLSSINSDFETYPQMIQRKFNDKDERYREIESQKLSNMAEYLDGTKNTTIQIRDREASKIVLKKSGGKNIMWFESPTGEMFVPSTPTNAATAQSLHQGSSTAKATHLKDIPEKTEPSTYIQFEGANAMVYSKDQKLKGTDESSGKLAKVYTDANGTPEDLSDDILLCTYSANALMRYMQKYFSPKAKPSGKFNQAVQTDGIQRGTSDKKTVTTKPGDVPNFTTTPLLPIPPAKK